MRDQLDSRAAAASAALAADGSAGDRRVAVADGVDTLIPANAHRRHIEIAVIGTGGPLLVAAAATTGGTNGRYLAAGGAATSTGETLWLENYTGPVSMRGVGSAVTVQVLEY